MSTTQLIARAIEKRDNLETQSFQPVADIPSDIDLVDLIGLKRNESTYRSIAVDAADKQVFQGKVVFMHDAFSDDPPYFHPSVENPTMMDLLVALNTGLIVNEDEHHCFLETLEIICEPNKFFDSPMYEGVEIPELNGATLINMQTGS